MFIINNCKNVIQFNDSVQMQIYFDSIIYLIIYLQQQLIGSMPQVSDEQALLLLLKSPKKKYIKHLLQYSAGLNICHNNPPIGFETALTQSFQQDMQLTKQQSHRLLLSLSQLIQIACSVGFNFENTSIFSQEFDQQLKEVLIGLLTGLQPEIIEARANSMRVGNKLVDYDWKLDLQVASEKGKANIPHVLIQIQSLRDSQLQKHKMHMKGEQFIAFFANLKKIKQNLLQLVDKGQKAQQ